MIQPRIGIAWVRDDDGRLTPFDADRLAASIHAACESTGHADQLLAESVAAAVHLYASECERDHVIAAGEIVRIVLEVLRMLTCDNVARAYTHRRERTEIRLDQLAVDNSGGFELEFFRRLDAVLRDASGIKEMAMLRLRGLRACVMRLRGAQRWGAGCRQQADDIVNFIRSRVVDVRSARAAALSLQVLD